MRIIAVILSLLFVVSPLQGLWFPGKGWLDEQFNMVKLQANCSAETTPNGIPIFTKPEKILALYQLMKDIHDVFTHYKVTYWVDSGTLLGAVRHQGVIPWDDDLDICIDKSSVETIYDIAPIFEQLGYEVIKLWGIFLRIQKKGDYNTFADLISTEQRECNIYFARFLPSYVYRALYGDWGVVGYRDGDEIFYTKDELYPLKEYKFGNFIVMGPQNPTKYLESMYGKDFLEVAYQWHAHQDGQFVKPKKVKMHLTEKDMVPAQPVGPMRDRVAALATLLP